ncbi:Ribokinase-like protein [Serendipita vermifera]|nr:Ribokinase-like protein [Serendipita vermifera]
MEKTILSIQSHVAHGETGGRAATFPLNLLGWEVDVVNTVNFSNHSGYRRRPGEGTRATGEQLKAIFNGLEMNGLLHPARLLTGYTPNADCLSAIVELVRKLRSHNSNLLFLLDPVLGDNGKLYVAADVIPLYRELLCSANIITPNWFEVETLVDFKLDSLQALRTAISVLHQKYGVPNVVVSSIPLTSQRVSWLPNALIARGHGQSAEGITYADEGLLCLASSRNDQEGEVSVVHATVIPQIRGFFSGVGDLFSAMILGHYDPSSEQTRHELGAKPGHSTALSHAVCNAIRTTHAVLRKTARASALVPGSSEDGFTDEELDARDESRRVRRMKARELRIVQSADIILRAGRIDSDEGWDLEGMWHWADFWA